MSTTTEQSPRYEARDGVRVAAMLLGVFYHALMFNSLIGGPVLVRSDRRGCRQVIVVLVVFAGSSTITRTQDPMFTFLRCAIIPTVS